MRRFHRAWQNCHWGCLDPRAAAPSRGPSLARPSWSRGWVPGLVWQHS